MCIDKEGLLALLAYHSVLSDMLSLYVDIHHIPIKGKLHSLIDVYLFYTLKCACVLEQ